MNGLKAVWYLASPILGFIIVWLVHALIPTYFGVVAGIIIAAIILVLLIIPTFGFTLVGAVIFVIFALGVIFDYGGETANEVVEIFINGEATMEQALGETVDNFSKP